MESAPGTSRASGDVRPEAAKWARPDIELTSVRVDPVRAMGKRLSILRGGGPVGKFKTGAPSGRARAAVLSPESYRGGRKFSSTKRRKMHSWTRRDLAASRAHPDGSKRKTPALRSGGQGKVSCVWARRAYARRSAARNRRGLPMPPIRLSDDELSAVMAAARPLDVRVRDAFLQQVANELPRCDEVGPGVVHRICAAAQRQFFDAPDLSVGAAGRSSKYR
jgi:hypothetical protein